MLTKQDYDKIVLAALESLERDIQDCKQFTVADYNASVEAEQKEMQARYEAEQQAKAAEEKKVTKKEDK